MAGIQNAFNQSLTDGLRSKLANAAQGDLLYVDSNLLFVRLGIGANGTILGANNGIPAWTSTITPTSNAGGVLSGTYPNPGLAASVVQYSNIQNVSASQRLLGRNTSGAGIIEELDPATARTLLGLGTAALVNTGTASGNVPVLDSNGYLPTSTIPPIGLSRYRGTVADQTARLALSNGLVGDWVIQSDNGRSYILVSTPASTNANWQDFADRLIDASDVVSGMFATSLLATGTASSSTYLRGDRTWVALGAGATFVWNTVSGTTQTLASNNGYVATNASMTTFTLPSSGANANSIIRLVGSSSGGWRIAQNAGQSIVCNDDATTVGVTGRVDTTGFTGATARSCVELICTTANTTWQIINANGNIYLS